MIGKKKTKVDGYLSVHKRLMFLMDCLTKRYNIHLAKTFYEQKFPDANATNFGNEWKEAKQMVKEGYIKPDIEQRLAEAKNSREAIIRAAWDKDDIKTVLEAEKDFAKLEELYDRARDDRPVVVFNFAGAPVAESDDGPVGDSLKETFLASMREASDDAKAGGEILGESDEGGGEVQATPKAGKVP